MIMVREGTLLKYIEGWIDLSTRNIASDVSSIAVSADEKYYASTRIWGDFEITRLDLQSIKRWNADRTFRVQKSERGPFWFDI